MAPQPPSSSISPLRPSTNFLGIKDEDFDLASNTLLCGLSVAYIASSSLSLTLGMSVTLGMISMVANVALSKLHEHTEQDPPKSWIPLQKESWDKFSSSFNQSAYRSFSFNFVLGLIFRVALGSFYLPFYRNVFLNPAATIAFLAVNGLIKPIAKEIVFRGFVQEKIKDIQIHVLGEKEANTPTQKKIRILIQAVLATLIEFDPQFPKFSAFLSPFYFLMSYRCGEVKESDPQNDLCKASGTHACFMTAAASRIIVFGL